jgi:ferredoxin-NADP reductase
MSIQRAVLERVDPVAEGVVSLVLRGVGGPLAPWDPGAHIDLTLPNWVVRQYSLCGDPTDTDTYRIAVRHEALSRGGSEYVHKFLRTGHRLEVSQPRNNFPLLPASEYLFIAGGIGITPMVPMLAAAIEAGAQARLVYVGRSRTSMPFADELESVHGDRVRIWATEQDGRPDLVALAASAPEALVYCCGPTAMLDAAEAAFLPQQLHVERFEPTVREFAPNTDFEVKCARSGKIIQVGADETVLDALNYAGYPVDSGCREGICGSCEIVVLDGEPEHRDDIGAPAGRMYCCVSRSLSASLTVDL